MHTSSLLAGASLLTAAVLVACGGSEFSSSEQQSSVGHDGGATGGRAGSGAGGHAAGGKDAGTSTGGDAAGGAGAGHDASTGGTSGRIDSGVDAASGAGGAGGTGGLGSGGITSCTAPTTFYPDADQDDYGRSTGTVVACAAPSGNWAVVGGDCDDDNPLVHPQQTAYFDVAYDTSGGVHSFDYDCSNTEEGDPSQLGPAPNCGLLSIVGCSGVGYASTSRSGSGVNVLCGSTVQVTCKANGLACSTVKTDVAVAYRCR